VLHNNAFTVNSFHPQQRRLYVPVFEGNHIPKNLRSFTRYICTLH